MSDIYGKAPLNLKQAVTADRCTITWDGKDVAQAVQFSLEYSQSVTRRRSIGQKDAVIYGGQPTGRATMARLITSGGSNVGDGDSWLACKSGTMMFEMGGNCGGTGDIYHATGCIVTSFSLQASSEDLTVMDNVVIEFLELSLDNVG